MLKKYIGLTILSISLFSGCSREEIVYDNESMHWIKKIKESNYNPKETYDYQTIIDEQLKETMKYQLNSFENSRE